MGSVLGATASSMRLLHILGNSWWWLTRVILEIQLTGVKERKTQDWLLGFFLEQLNRSHFLIERPGKAQVWRGKLKILNLNIFWAECMGRSQDGKEIWKASDHTQDLKYWNRWVCRKKKIVCVCVSRTKTQKEQHFLDLKRRIQKR